MRNQEDLVAHLILGLALLCELYFRPRDGPNYVADATRLAEVTAEALELGVRDSLAKGLSRTAGELAMNERKQASTRSESMKPIQQTQRLATVVLAAFAMSLGPASAQDVLQIGPYSGTFGEPWEVSELNNCAPPPWSPSLTEDGLVIVFSRDFVLYYATRESRDDDFGMPEPIDELNFGSPGNPNISPDGLVIVFDSRGASRDLFIAERDTQEEPGDPRVRFGELVRLDAPIDDGGDESDGQLSRDGLKLYFGRFSPGFADLFVAVRPNHDVPWSDDRVEVTRLDGTDTPSGDGNLSLSSGGEVIFWSQWFPLDAQDPDSDIWYATAVGDTGAVFAGKQSLPFPVNTTAHENAPWISYDWPAPGSTLWFIREVQQGCSLLYEAEWYPAPGPFLRGDSNGDGDINITDASFSLDWLFGGGPEPDCLAALNTNGDDRATSATRWPCSITCSRETLLRLSRFRSVGGGCCQRMNRWGVRRRRRTVLPCRQDHIPARTGFSSSLSAKSDLQGIEWKLAFRADQCGG